MSRGPRSPDHAWFPFSLAAAALIAMLSGGACYFNRIRANGIDSMSDQAREELAARPVSPRATAAVEQKWVTDDGFKSELLIAPVGPQPCEACADRVPYSERAAVLAGLDALRDPDPDTRIEGLAEIHARGPGNLLIALMRGTELIHLGRDPEAERVISEALDSTDLDERIMQAARTSASLDLDDLQVSTVIHLHHALGVARLSQSSAEPPWVSLKNVIGSVRPLVRRRFAGTHASSPTWSRITIAAPGCPRGAAQALSTYDLYNNLIISYMRKKFPADDIARNREFTRPDRSDPSALLRLFLGQLARERSNGWKNESELWALSNVQQVIDERIPNNARLALNAVQVIDLWTTPERCPKELCTDELRADIRAKRDTLIEQAFKERNVAPEQHAAFARAAIGALASSSLDRSRVSDAASSMRDWLTSKQQQQTLDDLLAADAARTALPAWTFAPHTESTDGDKEPPHKKLGSRGERWYAAARTDLAAAAAPWITGRPAGEQRSDLIAIRQMLAGADAPPELEALEQQRTWSDRLMLRVIAAKWFWAIVALLFAGLVALILLWILIHLREWSLLRTSLYNIEMEHLASIDVRQGEGR